VAVTVTIGRTGSALAARQWRHVSKYPPSLSYYGLELGILFLCLALLRAVDERTGVRKDGVLFVFGQTPMFFYLAHRLAFDIPAIYLGLRGFDGLTATYGLAAVVLVCLDPACRWYRGVKAARPTSILRYL
jgi:hypothetical protein